MYLLVLALAGIISRLYYYAHLSVVIIVSCKKNPFKHNR